MRGIGIPVAGFVRRAHGFEDFRFALRPMVQKAHPALRDPQPRLAVVVCPCQPSLPLSFFCLASILRIAAHGAMTHESS
jgi:hypothetical protein